MGKVARVKNGHYYTWAANSEPYDIAKSDDGVLF